MSKKITELTALAAPAATDLAVVVDMSGTPTTKKSTLAQLSTAITLAISQVTGLAADLATRALASVTLTAGGGLTGGGDLSANRTFTIGAGTGITVNADDVAVNYGTTGVTACVGNDARLSDARTPTAHATSHKSAGSDPIRIDELKIGTDVTTLNATTTEHGLLKKLPGDTTTFLRADGNFAAPSADGAGIRQAFRGLHLRTHPDNVSMLSKVMLVHADEVVFDDGTRVASGLDNLVADITASGAGGLDTGTEGASRWYEIYVIRKSSDGTLNALLHRAKDWTSDTSFTTARDASRVLRLATSTATDKLAQGIQFANSKPFVFVDTELVRAGSPSGSIWFTLESDSGGSPSGSVLATSDKIDVLAVFTSNQIVRVKFRTPYTVTASTQYHLVLQGDYTRSDTVNIAWRGVAAGGYANGSAKQYNGSVWSAATGVGDFYFNAFTEQNDVAVTMPSGYDQKCLIGHVYNGSGSDFDRFVSVNRLVRRRALGNFVNAGTSTFPALVSLSSLVPPITSLLRSVMFSPSGAGDVYFASDCAPGGGNSLTDYGVGTSFNFTPNVGISGLADVPCEMQSVYYSIATMVNIYIYLLDYEW